MGIISFHVFSSLSKQKVYGPFMIMKNRKLFPTSTNQTDCPEFCDPTSACPYGCYPYPGFYFFPPPPQLPPPPTSTDQSQILSSNVIIMVSVLASFLLLLSYYLIIVKYCSRQTHLESDGQDVEFAYENQEPAIDHPIWFIHTVGLQPSVINAITAFKYRRSDVLIEVSECSVCLSEFQEDETLRLLPKCHHAFHIPCIDTWLRSHTNCPLCRAGILSNSWSAINPSPSEEQNALNLRPEEETQIDDLERNDEVGENRTETERVIGFLDVDGERRDVDGSKDQNCLSLMPEDSESNGYLGGKMAETEDEIDLPRFHDKRKELPDSKDGRISNSGGVFFVVESEVKSTMDFSSANPANRIEDFPQSNMGIV